MDITDKFQAACRALNDTGRDVVQAAFPLVFANIARHMKHAGFRMPEKEINNPASTDMMLWNQTQGIIIGTCHFAFNGAPLQEPQFLAAVTWGLAIDALKEQEALGLKHDMPRIEFRSGKLQVN